MRLQSIVSSGVLDLMRGHEVTWLAIGSLVLLAALQTAFAGPYCGSAHGVAPADGSTLPVGPTIAVNVEDTYYGGSPEKTASVGPLRVTLDGKPIKFTKRDVRTTDGLIRFITINSRKTGRLAVGIKSRWENAIVPYATYTIVNDWTPPASASASVRRDIDTRLGPYRRLGYRIAVRVDIPAIAFWLRWRQNALDAWKLERLAATITNGHSEAQIGQTMCGMVENVPLALLETGVDVELSAMLPDGRAVAITDGLPSPLTIPPKLPGSRETSED